MSTTIGFGTPTGIWIGATHIPANPDLELTGLCGLYICRRAFSSRKLLFAGGFLRSLVLFPGAVTRGLLAELFHDVCRVRGPQCHL